MGRGRSSPGLGRSHYCHFFLVVYVSLLLLPSVDSFAFLLLPSSRRGLRLTMRRFGLDNPSESPLTAPTASHSIVSRPFGGLYCRKCGERTDFKTNCAPAAAEKAAAHAEMEAERAAAHAEKEAERAAAHAEKEAERAAAHAEMEAERAATHALEIVKINAAAKESFARNATSVMIACLALAVVSFFSREVAAWVKTAIVPLLNSTREWLIGLASGAFGFLVGIFSK